MTARKQDARTAADWVARRDRGLTPAEQDEYLQWLREDPQRARHVAAHEATLRRMQALGAWQPVVSQEANPDLFAPRRRRRTWLLPTLAAMAAAIALTWILRPPAPIDVALKPGGPLRPSFLRVNERQGLSDGSLVELRDGSRIEVQFSAAERRVRLIRGEAHFTVAKDAGRPFIAEAGGVAVRAVGTAFNVRFDPSAVDVLVTEGRVEVAAPPSAAPSEPVVVTASQRTVVPLRPGPGGAEVVTVTPAQAREVLAWQRPRLQFHETPLAEAAAEFNRHNRVALVPGDPEVGRVLIGGTFRADNVEGFVRLLEVTFGIHGEAMGDDRIVLRRVK